MTGTTNDLNTLLARIAAQELDSSLESTATN